MPDFRMIRQIGSGATSVVYLVQSVDDPSECYAVKEVDFEKLDHEGRELALQEVKIIQSLCHTNVIRIHNTTFVNQKLRIFMEHAEHGDLYGLLLKQTRFLPEDKILDIFTQICLSAKFNT
jgi:serine/threonine protein kinase